MPYAGLRDFHRQDSMLGGPHTALARLEVWRTSAGGRFLGYDETSGLLDDDAEHITFSTSGKWVTGIRRSLSLTVPATQQWKTWLGMPELVLRPFVGVEVSRAEPIEWIPQGVFVVQQRPWSLKPGGGVSVQGSDMYSRLLGVGALPPQGYGGLTRDAIGNLIRLTNPWQFRVFVDATSEAVCPPVVLNKRRHDIIKDLNVSIGAETFAGRDGYFYIQDRKYRPADMTLFTGPTGTVGDIVETLDRSNVKNIITVASSNTGASFDPVTVSVMDPDDPAYFVNIGGYYDDTITSSLVTDSGQALQMATAELAKAKETARSLAISCVPNYRLDPGDGVNLLWPDGKFEYLAIRSITYPHPEDTAPQEITAVTSMGPDDE